MKSRKVVTYKLICKSCGKVFESRNARVNCSECGSYRSAQSSVDSLGDRKIIGMNDLKLSCELYHCRIESARSVLKAKGFRKVSILTSLTDDELKAVKSYLNLYLDQILKEYDLINPPRRDK